MRNLGNLGQRFNPGRRHPISKPDETTQESQLWSPMSARYQEEKAIMNDLEKILGKAISVKELAEYLGISEKTVRDNYKQLGGCRIGRHYRFFTKEVANALEKRQEQIRGASQEERSAEREGIPDAERGKGMGGSAKKNVRRRVERDDKHNLFS